jgi:hypothetical protein
MGEPHISSIKLLPGLGFVSCDGIRACENGGRKRRAFGGYFRRPFHRTPKHVGLAALGSYAKLQQLRGSNLLSAYCSAFDHTDIEAI